MKLIINKDDLLEGLQNVQKAVATKSNLAILSGILLETLSEDRVKIAATDLEIGIETIISGEVVEKGNIVLPARYLVDIVRKLDDSLIQINVDKQNNTADIHSGYFNMTIHGFSGEEFPVIPWVNEGFDCNLEQGMLKKMISQTVFATSHDESRPFLTGVLFSLQDKLRLVATDGHRLALREASFNSEVEERGVGAIIPSKAVNELIRLLDDEENKQVQVRIGENQVSFQIENVRLITRLIEGQFPSYQQVVPQGYKTRIKLNREELASALERASLIVRGESNIVKQVIQKDKLIITSNTPEIGKSSEEVACLLEGEEMQIAFNFKYFLDVLKVIESEEVTIDLTGSLSPGVIRPVGDDCYTYVIMPVRSH